MSELHPHLAGEFRANLDRPGRGPDMLTRGSENRCSWACATCGHEWVATAAMRAAGRGCPRCGRARSNDINSRPMADRLLVDHYPKVAASFVANLTRPGKPVDELTAHSRDRCEWRCEDCGRTWQTTVDARVRGGCRECSQARAAIAPPGSSLADAHPHLASEFVENLDRPGHGPDVLHVTSTNRCRWRCARCGTETEASVAARSATRAARDNLSPTDPAYCRHAA
ncbi:MAG TPA: zinc-ribbon domain-containing protein [Acidimicrobiales bacterium]|nr:zinc-ribbon domain-containing protein [Acidimicrobiales bacterium]